MPRKTWKKQSQRKYSPLVYICQGADDINDPFKPELTLDDSVSPNSKQPSSSPAADGDSKDGESKDKAEEGGEKGAAVDSSKDGGAGSSNTKESSDNSAVDVAEKAKEVENEENYSEFQNFVVLQHSITYIGLGGDNDWFIPGIFKKGVTKSCFKSNGQIQNILPDS